MSVDLEQEYTDYAESLQGTIGAFLTGNTWESWVEHRVEDCGLPREAFDEVDEDRLNEVIQELAPECPCCGWHCYEDELYGSHPDYDLGVCGDCNYEEEDDD